MAREHRVLALESSCDETACAIVEGRRVLASVVASQIETHAPFGGVVPELASRAHLDAATVVTRAALDRAEMSLDEIDALAVTHGPGLIGALLVGVQMAKGLALATAKPLLGIHHMEGHLFSTGLIDAEHEGPTFAPHLALLVSGGHTELVEVRGLGKYRRIGGTRDDAVGEAYDKVAKMLGLGYPGGPVVDRLAQAGRGDAVAFPRAMIDSDDDDFSFAGLKTAVAVHLEREGLPKTRPALEDLCASFQAAVVEVLAHKTLRARRRSGLNRLCVVGGAAANSGVGVVISGAAVRSSVPIRGAGPTAGTQVGIRRAAGDLRGTAVDPGALP